MCEVAYVSKTLKHQTVPNFEVIFQETDRDKMCYKETNCQN